MSDEKASQTPVMVGISLVILVLAARLLYLVDQSLREGEGMGLSGEGAIETIPILVLLGLLIWMVARSGTNTKVDTGASDTQLIGIMLGMFLLGLYIGPGISLSLESELIGMVFLVIPILLIGAILLPGDDDSLVTVQEEE
ncbi:MAG: hypothetical protein DBX04_04700 [Candidatus Poseidoniales archaeon]|nr:MAG: hypothetical protein DBX04_04700 [Candidatus Poseidoniales archaeon]